MVMASPLLETKLYVPRWRRGLVPRLRLSERLNRGAEFEHITLARVLLARGALAEACGLLERLLHAAEDGGRTHSAIEILVLQALALQARGDRTAALGRLERALRLAEPEGYVRIVVDEGPPMARLLAQAEKQGIARHYVRELLAACHTADDGSPVTHGSVNTGIEPLSERELEVLRLLGTDLDGPEIARELVVSLNTMRTHTRTCTASSA